MSTFKGKLEEIPGISVDRFDGENIESQAFFLSHCHTDHMIGLGHSNFQKKLVDEGRSLYTSHVSAEILKKTYPALKDNLMELDLYTPTIISLSSGKSFSVIPIPAGHCPGSVMFLFESERTVLYTGDFRIHPGDISKCNAFYNSANIQKKVDAIYLDTTFFLKKYTRFPTRAESLEEICSIIKEWIERGERYAVNLNTSAKYGYEYLFIEIYKKFKIPIHVNEEIYEFYSRVPELDQAVTTNKDKTQIHTACGLSYSNICAELDAFVVKTIKISAFRWNSKILESGISDRFGKLNFVCYSTHASHEEVGALLRFLKPDKIEPNVLHGNEKDKEIYENISEFLEADTKGPVTKKAKLFDIGGGPSVQDKEGEKIGDGFSFLDSPPRNYKF